MLSSCWTLSSGLDTFKKDHVAGNLPLDNCFSISKAVFILLIKLYTAHCDML